MVQAVHYFSIFILFILYEPNEAISVCKDFESYDHKRAMNCHDNPDGERNMTEILIERGLIAEEYTIETDDGYQLSLVRTYFCINTSNPVVLGHTTFQAPISWVTRREKSLGIYLAEAGFDVWIIGFRGSQGSRGHKKLTTNDDDYWNFSFDEMAKYDLKSTLDMVKSKTGKKAIYIGHGTGGNIGLAYGSLFPTEAKENLKGMILLGASPYIANMKSYMSLILPLMPILKTLIFERSHGEVLTFASSRVDYCANYPFQMFVCETLDVPIFGDGYAQIDPLDEPIIQARGFDNTGYYVMEHFYHMQKSNRFQQRDFGAEINYQKYGNATPPEYEIKNIPVPVALVVGQNDWVSTKFNNERIYSELQDNCRSAMILVDYNKFTHRDFVTAKDIIPLLYQPLLVQLGVMCG